MKYNREEILNEYYRFCENRACTDCQYYTEEMMRDVPCAALFVLDRVESIIRGIPEKKKKVKNEISACDIMEMLKRVMDVNYGKRAGESDAQYRERKFKVFNAADEMIGNTEPQCEE